MKDDPKEVILSHIQRFIKTNRPVASGEQEILKNLREFLCYLEAKNIVNPTKLQDKQKMKELLSDIMKLDLEKFSKPRGSSGNS